MQEAVSRTLGLRPFLDGPKGLGSLYEPLRLTVAPEGTYYMVDGISLCKFDGQNVTTIDSLWNLKPEDKCGLEKDDVIGWFLGRLRTTA